jgi:hypothetical protein
MSIVSFYKKYEHHLNALAFVGGFIFDLFALQRVDHLISQIILTSWLVGAGACIVLHSVVHRPIPRTGFWGRGIDWIAALLPFIIQFAFGAVLSGSLVFFSRSASLSITWPFLLILIALIVGNELFRSRYSSLAFQCVTFFIATFLYATLFVPLFLKDVGQKSFLVSGVFSVVAFIILTRFVRWFSFERYKASRILMWIGMITFYALFHVLYFKNLIPPLPLSLEEIGIYHHVSRDNQGNFILSYEPPEKFSLSEVSSVYHQATNEPVFVFTAVFAPRGITAKIVHQWSFFDDVKNAWIPSSRINFDITGGRDSGYRSYSMKENAFPGKWRVDVLTDSGKLIGRTTFSIVKASGTVLQKKLVR